MPDLERIPPYDADAEAALLGSCLLDGRAITEAACVLPRDASEAFYGPAHRTLYECILDLHDSGRPVDLVTFRNFLYERGKLDEVGGVDALVRLAESVPSWHNAAYYAHLVEQGWRKRRAIQGCRRIEDLAYGAGEFEEVWSGIEREAYGLSERRQIVRQVTLPEMLDEMFADLERQYEGGLTGVPTGFWLLDDMTGGMQAGEMIIVAARPSVGKSAWALQAAVHAAKQGHCAGLWSLEMDRRSLSQRLVCMEGDVDSKAIRRRTLNPVDYQNLEAARQRLQGLPLHIDDAPGIGLMDLRARIRYRHQRDGMRIAFVDYLQLIEYNLPKRSREQEVAAISKSLKGLARELGIPLVVTAQLNRNPEAREGGRPRKSDLRESGACEQDADVIILLHREEASHVGDKDWAAANQDKIGRAEMIVDKQRNGPTGTVECWWEAQFTRFATTETPRQAPVAEPEPVRLPYNEPEAVTAESETPF